MAFHATGGLDPAGLFPPSRFPKRPSPCRRRQGDQTDTRSSTQAPPRPESGDRRRGRDRLGVDRVGRVGQGRDAGDRRARAQVHTRSGSVGDLLTDQGVPLSIGLQVQPPASTTLADGMTVVVSPPPGVPADGFDAAVSPAGVGVWVVERPDAGPFGKADPATEEASTFAAGVGPSGVTVRAVVSGKVHDVSTNAGTTEALIRPWGSKPTLTIASSHHPAPPFTTGAVRFDSIRTVMRRLMTPVPFPVRTDYTRRSRPRRRSPLSGRGGA